MKHPDMDEIYRTLPPEEIPWVVEEPPGTLVDLVESGDPGPCKAIDLGCGTGSHAIYLAGRGYRVTGVDLSPTAVALAREKAKNKGVSCDFIVADVLGDLREVDGTFDFAYDWELLHHIFPGQREKYVEHVAGLLNPKGRYLSVCFSEGDPQFGGSGKYRETPLGTVLYFSSEAELRDLFQPLFQIRELKTIQVPGKTAPHLAIYAFMQKRRKRTSSPR
jgi:SAM-dependent methyltransferase